MYKKWKCHLVKDWDFETNLRVTSQGIDNNEEQEWKNSSSSGKYGNCTENELPEIF